MQAITQTQRLHGKRSKVCFQAIKTDFCHSPRPVRTGVTGYWLFRSSLVGDRGETLVEAVAWAVVLWRQDLDARPIHTEAMSEISGGNG
jgi:hypothetical protein